MDLINELTSALQVSLKSIIAPLGGVTIGTHISILFKKIEDDDDGLEILQKIFKQGSWHQKSFRFLYPHQNDDIRLLINFLFLTRLKMENIQKIIQIDDRFKVFATHLMLPEGNTITSPKETAKIVFNLLSQKKWTLRYLAEQTGLTQVALSNFKSGKDIRLTSLFKILSALGLKMRLGL